MYIQTTVNMYVRGAMVEFSTRDLQRSPKELLDAVERGEEAAIVRGGKRFRVRLEGAVDDMAAIEKRIEELEHKVASLSSAGIQGASPAVGVPNRPVGTFDPTKIPGVTKGFPQEQTVTGGDWGA